MGESPNLTFTYRASDFYDKNNFCRLSKFNKVVSAFINIIIISILIESWSFLFVLITIRYHNSGYGSVLISIILAAQSSPIHNPTSRPLPHTTSVPYIPWHNACSFRSSLSYLLATNCNVYMKRF